MTTTASFSGEGFVDDDESFFQRYLVRPCRLWACLVWPGWTGPGRMAARPQPSIG